MPLASPLLQAGLLQVFKDQQNMTPRLAAQKMAKAYDDYAKTALAGAFPPIFTGTEVQKLEKTLFSAISEPRAGAAPLIAAAWGAGVVAYWSAPPVLFAGPIPGASMVLLAAPAMGIIVPALTACFQNSKNTEESAAALMASILDGATRTVMVLITLPPPASPVTLPLL